MSQKWYTKPNGIDNSTWRPQKKFIINQKNLTKTEILIAISRLGPLKLMANSNDVLFFAI